MKILFVGGTNQNAGPANVNKAILKNFSNNFWYSKYSNKYIKIADLIIKLLFSDVVVVSGIDRYGCILMESAKLLGKKSVYIMHGCSEYETQVNNLQNNEKALRTERKLLNKADLILPVSKRFMDWVKTRYPHYAYKTSYLFNGVDRNEYQLSETIERNPGLVVAVGGDRGSKNNGPVCDAVEQLQGIYHLEICGRIHNGIPNHNYKYVRYMDVIPKEEFLNKLKSADVFILNSIFEPFSLSVIDALNCGCNVLVSNQAGVADILELEENDIIYDPMDHNEIKRKLLRLREYPNNQRISRKIDYNKWSTKESVKRLEQLCADLL